MLKPYESLQSLRRSSTMDLLTELALTLHLVSVAFLWLDHESGMDYHMSYDSVTHFRVSSLIQGLCFYDEACTR